MCVRGWGGGRSVNCCCSCPNAFQDFADQVKRDWGAEGGAGNKGRSFGGAARLGLCHQGQRRNPVE